MNKFPDIINRKNCFLPLSVFDHQFHGSLGVYVTSWSVTQQVPGPHVSEPFI